MIFFTFGPSDQTKTLTYVLMDNFCPCFDLMLREMNQTNICIKLRFGLANAFNT